MPIPKAVIAGPDRAPLPFGLFSTLTFRDAGDGRWEAGGTFETLDCSPLDGVPAWDAAPAVPANHVKDLGRNVGGVGNATAFTVYGHSTLDPVAGSFASASARAQARLLFGEERRVEQALWTGDLGNTPNLAGTGASPAKPLGTTATAPAQAVAVLENWLGDVLGAQGVLHVSRWLATHLLNKELAEIRGARLVTKLGTPIAAGSGYPGTGDALPASGYVSQWAFITPPIFGYRSEVFMPENEVFDQRNNDIYALAERTYLLAMDTCGFAGVQINPTL